MSTRRPHTPSTTEVLDRAHPCSTRTPHPPPNPARRRLHAGRAGQCPSWSCHPQKPWDARAGRRAAPSRGATDGLRALVLDRLDPPSRAQGVLHPHADAALTAPSARAGHGGMEPTPPTHPAPPPPLGLAEAAAACGVHVDTLRRALRRGAIPGAVRSSGPNGAWELPHDGLVAAGFNPTAGAASPTLREALEALSAAVALVATALEVRP